MEYIDMVRYCEYENLIIQLPSGDELWYVHDMKKLSWGYIVYITFGALLHLIESAFENGHEHVDKETLYSCFLLWEMMAFMTIYLDIQPIIFWELMCKVNTSDFFV